MFVAASGAGGGAFLGALAGAVFGDGDVLDDALEGAVVGGGVGAIAGALEGGAVDRAQQQQLDALIRAFGEENLRGYVELIQCNHKKAIAYFKVGQVSDIKDHQLTGFWLEAIAEKDNRNTTYRGCTTDLLQVAGIVLFHLEKRLGRQFSIGGCPLAPESDVKTMAQFT